MTGESSGFVIVFVVGLERVSHSPGRPCTCYEAVRSFWASVLTSQVLDYRQVPHTGRYHTLQSPQLR